MEERIENYFEQQLSDTEKAQFEADLKSDPELADAVAFYLVSKDAASQAAKAKKLTERHAEWQSLKKPEHTFTSLRTWYAVAAAVALVCFASLWYWMTPANNDIQQLADGYVIENFTTLSVQMGGSEGNGGDSIQLAINNYNNGQYATSKTICENILKRDPENAEAKKIAGIVSLKQQNYDKAIDYFHELGEQKNLYSNPGKFYEAIALLKSGLPLNKKKAEKLLQEVIDGNLEGKAEAEKWLGL